MTPFRRRPALAIALGAALLSACVPAHRHPSWAIYPLQRVVPHDGLAVVSQPDGYGLHIWLDTDTRQSGRCQPRWSVDAARLFNGNGSAPFSSGLAPRQEFFQAVARAEVQRALRQQSEALCRQRAPRSSFSWVEPPRNAAEIKPETYPLLEESDLLSDPNAVLEQEERLLQSAPTAPAQPGASSD
ncbi:hypothetical protein [Cyanobium sp. Aljojuca 7D2]|uniref:hypothetical protein n=1 Tax=Cyanobium sp. Aljojuca 7D2 TaxID=2823698 RepID=UPI0020CC5773|nr:hypothetical protein [Cyanobium sp. Aljojuca 7D2]